MRISSLKVLSLGAMKMGEPKHMHIMRSRYVPFFAVIQYKQRSFMVAGALFFGMAPDEFI